MPYWKGIFEIPRVPPGEYRLTIEPHASRPGQEGREFVDTMVDVTDHDLDLSLTVGPGASLTGHVVAEPSGAVTTPIGLRVTASKAHERFAAGLPIAAAVNGDWSFRMTGLSGSYEFFVSSDRPPPMLVATRVIIDGTSYLAAGGIALADGDHDVVVFVAPREAPKPTVDNTQTSSALVEQFKNEQVFRETDRHRKGHRQQTRRERSRNPRRSQRRATSVRAANCRRPLLRGASAR